MQAVTHAQVKDVVGRLPVQKLPIAYRLLTDLERSESSSASRQQQFMALPLEERKRLLAIQAQQMLGHYEEIRGEVEEWEVGDFVEY